MSEESAVASRCRIAAWILWLMFVAAVSFSVYADPERSVTQAYRQGVERWFNGEPLYNGKGSGFIYFPQAALTFAPFTLFPESLGEVFWRWTTVGLFALGVARLTRLAGCDGARFLVVSLVATALAWSGARNGQATLPLAGLLMLAVGDISEERWWRATWLLILALSCKPLAIVLMLLVGAIHRQLIWRLSVGLLVMLLVPFATQQYDYVVSQYSACLDMLRAVNHLGETGYWAQLFGLLKVVGWDVPSVIQLGTRLIAALATLLACWWAARCLTPKRFCFYVYAFSACYLMLFNSRTEANTYAMVAPVYGIAVAEAWLDRRSNFVVWMLDVMIFGTLGCYELGKLITPTPQAIWLSPLMCVGLTIYLVSRLVHEAKTRDGVTL